MFACNRNVIRNEINTPDDTFCFVGGVLFVLLIWFLVF